MNQFPSVHPPRPPQAATEYDRTIAVVSFALVRQIGLPAIFQPTSPDHGDTGGKSQTIERTITMKKQTLVLALIGAALVGSVLAGDPPVATPGPRCRTASWDPALYTFYGAKKTVAEKLDGITANLAERRVFLQVTQGDSTAEVKLYKQQDNGTYNVTVWTTKQATELLADIDKAIVANKGVNCVGEQVEGVLNTKLQEGEKMNKNVPAPENVPAAFKHSINNASGDFIKSTLIILC